MALALVLNASRTLRFGRAPDSAAHAHVSRNQYTAAMELSGWGRWPVEECRVEHLRRGEDAARVVAENTTLIARGNGRAYGDAALNQTLTLSMLAMDRLCAFDEQTGLLTCEAGVLLADILQTFVPRGWLPYAVPGTRFVTVGGMIAADVHGKNHHCDGGFGASVESFTLVTADGNVLECSREQRGELFRATIGGMGLTGIILAASFRLRRIETAFVTAEAVPTRDLDETLALFEESSEWQYNVAWIDCMATGGRMGRSILSRGVATERTALPPALREAPLRWPRRTARTVPIDTPSALTALLNRTSARLCNALYYARHRVFAHPRPLHLAPFFFPLDGIGAWNRLYGRRGFAQFQCVVPKAAGQAGIAKLLHAVAEGANGSFLAVLKLLGRQGEGMMSFPLEGYTLAIDFPMGSGTVDLLYALDEIAHGHGGRIYLAKDACSSGEKLRQGYPKWCAFNAVRMEASAAPPKFSSALSRRLGLDAPAVQA